MRTLTRDSFVDSGGALRFRLFFHLIACEPIRPNQSDHDIVYLVEPAEDVINVPTSPCFALAISQVFLESQHYVVHALRFSVSILLMP
jgi:hypothetical protein